MGLMIKHSLKNIFSKPLRLLLLIFCILFASFTALLAVDMKNNIEGLLNGYMMDMIGKVDIIAYNTSDEVAEELDAMAELRRFGIGSVMQYEYERDPSGYEYSFEKPIELASLSDIQTAYDMAFIPECFDLDDDSAVINKKYADEFGLSVGDSLHFETRDEVEIELKVMSIVDMNNAIFNGNSAIVSNEVVRRIACTPENDYNIWMIDVVKDSEISAVADAIRERDPKAELEVLSEQMDDADIQGIYNLFYLLFLISFLLVIFVTISIAEKIVNERMSVIGTLRSLGVSRGRTAFVLLIENVLYALIGSAIGIFLYSRVKTPILKSMVNGVDGTDLSQYFGPTPVYVYLLVVAAAILIECAYPLYELTKAVKTPIRDIIFDNKDTEFKYRWGRLYTGIVLLIASVVSGFLVKNFVTLAVSLVCGIVALALLIPFVIRLFSKAVTALCRKLSFPVAQLAAENISRNRIIMGTAVLCVTSITLSILIGCVGEALARDLSELGYDCDLVVDIYTSDDDHDYRYVDVIDGVLETDRVYNMPASGQLGEDKARALTFFADTAHSMMAGLPAEGYGLEENEIVLAQPMAKRLGLSVGDEVKLVLDPTTDFPTEKSFILKDTLDPDKCELLSLESVIMNRDLYDHLFSSRLAAILIRTEDAEGVKKSIEKNSESSSLRVQTLGELEQEQENNTKGLLSVMRMIVAGSAALTLIGVAGNQSLGFITRKRETALLYSVALPRNRIKRLLFLESLFSMGCSALIAGVTAPFFFRVLGYLLDVIADGDMDILSKGSVGAKEILMYLGVILFVFLLTTLIPSKYLRKMNIAEELKYE
ncbi:MAG: ABC transporter permease [Lachnospiraceae bacterium]|nr:ABC transporter permease [Lachnospiraceae bacterium]